MGWDDPYRHFPSSEKLHTHRIHRLHANLTGISCYVLERRDYEVRSNVTTYTTSIAYASEVDRYYNRGLVDLLQSDGHRVVTAHVMSARKDFDSRWMSVEDDIQRVPRLELGPLEVIFDSYALPVGQCDDSALTKSPNMTSNAGLDVKVRCALPVLLGPVE